MTGQVIRISLPVGLTLAALLSAGLRAHTVQIGSGTNRSEQTRFSIRLEDSESGKTVIHVSGLDAGRLDEETPQWTVKKWQRLLAVYVATGSEKVEAGLPPLLGSYRIKGPDLVFEPRFLLEPGVTYWVELKPEAAESDGRADGAGEGSGMAVVQSFKIPKITTTAKTFVEHVFPTAQELPENLLKFYIHFSAPMSRGQAYRRIRLLDEEGDTVELPFLELQQELWDVEGSRFTLFFDPGRIKRGLLPNQQVGLPLRAGHTYTLWIDRGWPDATGQPLEKEFRKRFRVRQADRRSPSVSTWQFTAPKEGAISALTVRFPESLDHALLMRLVEIVDPQGDVLDGNVIVASDETCWRFEPKHPWGAGTHTLRVSTLLEDLVGNSIERPFEVELEDGVVSEEAGWVEVKFEIEKR